MDENTKPSFLGGIRPHPGQHRTMSMQRNRTRMTKHTEGAETDTKEDRQIVIFSSLGNGSMRSPSHTHYRNPYLLVLGFLFVSDVFSGRGRGAD